MRPRRLSIEQARRMALAAQGFAEPRPAGRVDVRHLRAVARRLGLIQLDFVNVLVPAHYQVPFSRLGPYERSRLDDLAYRRREMTEHWAHEASLVLTELRPLLEYRRRDHRPRPWPFARFLEEHPDYCAAALDQIRREGALTPADLPDPPGDGDPGHDWYSSVARCVLEAYFGSGELAVVERRPNFARVYDLTERVIPSEHREDRVALEEAHRRLLLRAARAHGVATAADLADYWRMSMAEATPRIAELVETGALQPARVEGWRQEALVHPEARLPRRVRARALVSPFDPLVWTRDRVARVFGMDYRLEIFVPAAKRRWGYYVLPFLLGDRLVARVDLKADRPRSTLRVRAAYLEPHADADIVAAPLAEELGLMAGWLGLDRVGTDDDGDLAGPLRSALDDGGLR